MGMNLYEFGGKGPIDDRKQLNRSLQGSSIMLREADRHLERVIYRAIQDAKLAGQDDTHQDEVAVRTLRWTLEALTAVRSVRRKRSPEA
jgi:hypothetical protein